MINCGESVLTVRTIQRKPFYFALDLIQNVQRSVQYGFKISMVNCIQQLNIFQVKSSIWPVSVRQAKLVALFEDFNRNLSLVKLITLCNT